LARNRPDTDLDINRAIDQPMETGMTAIARAFSNVIPAISPDVDILKTVALFCGAGLFVFLLLASYGLDMSVGFF
jgi:hypothetical protein